MHKNRRLEEISREGNGHCVITSKGGRKNKNETHGDYETKAKCFVFVSAP